MTGANSTLGTLYREEHARVLSSVLARVRDFPLAEECVQDAFAKAAEQWRTEAPPHPRAWLIRVATNKAIDRLRRRAKFPEVEAEALAELEGEGGPVPETDSELHDERLRLVFTCCHPALAPEAQVTLTLRTVAGLTTQEIARLFFAEPEAIAQRLVRTQRKIRDARIPYAVPAAEALAERLGAVLLVVYLVFTEGYARTGGDSLVRAELCDEAIRLGRLIVELLPSEPEAQSLLALMLLHDARRDARFTADGEVVLLEQQDRSKWKRSQIAEALAILEEALNAGANGPYALQAAIAGLHARAPTAADTDYLQILAIYDLLIAIQRTPVIELNRAVAVAMAHGPEAGLKALHALRLLLGENHLFHAARADLLARLGRHAEAARAYRAALVHVIHPAEKRFLEGRLAACDGAKP